MVQLLMLLHAVTTLVASLTCAAALDNGLARKPPMVSLCRPKSIT
jgi:hypothetical protein